MRTVQQDHTSFSVSFGSHRIEIEFPELDIVRLRLGSGTGPDSSYLTRRKDPRPFGVSDGPFIALFTEAQTVCVRPELGGFDFCDRSGSAQLRLTVKAECEQLRLAFEALGEQHFYGLGQGGAPFDRLGASRRLWNCHVNHGLGGDISIPLLLSDAGYALFFDNSRHAGIDAGHSYDEICFGYTTAKADLDLYCLWGDGLRALLDRIAGFLGRAPMPPRWSLGYLQSTRHFDTADEIRNLADEFRTRGLPCDGLILLSTYGKAKGWNRGVGHLEFEPELFRDPEGLLKHLRKLNFRILTHEYPVLSEDSALFEEAEAAGYLLDCCYPDRRHEGRSDNYHSGQRFLDFSNPETGVWWWEQHRELLQQGIDGWWLDGGEGPMQTAAGDGLHNRYDLLRQKSFAEGEARDRPAQRPFFLVRSGGPGMQRYGAACWSGDIDASFAALEAQIAIGLNVGLSGVPYWGTDIGGYYPSIGDTGELFARWFAFGAFCPLFRSHGRQWRMHTPWAHGPEIEGICRTFLELRSRLMPYTYTLAWEAHCSGLPLMRPLVLNYPDDPQCHNLASQFLWGDDLLVAPVTRPGASHWPVYLPAGEWHDYWTGARHDGGCGVTVESPLDRIPLFVRAGSILPLAPVTQQWSASLPQTLSLLIYPSGQSCFDLYEDDGASQAYASGEFAVTRLECQAGPGAASIRIGEPYGRTGLIPPHRTFEVRLHALEQPQSVSVKNRSNAPGNASFRWDSGTLLVGPIRGPAEVELIW